MLKGRKTEIKPKKTNNPKTSYTIEKCMYVQINLSRSERPIRAQFRCGILLLRIETGRYVGEKPKERLCKVVKVVKLKMNCIFFLTVFCIMSLELTCCRLLLKGINSCYFLMSKNSKHLMNNYPRQIAEYLRNAFEKRKQFLYK